LQGSKLLFPVVGGKKSKLFVLLLDLLSLNP